MEAISSDVPEVPPMTVMPAEVRSPATRLKQHLATGSRTSNSGSPAKKTLAVSDVYPWLLEWLEQIQERHPNVHLPVKAMSVGFVTVEQLKAVMRQLPMEELLQFNKVADTELQQLAGTSALRHDEATNVIVDNYLHSMQRPYRKTHHGEEDVPQLHTRRAPWEAHDSASKQDADTFAAFTFVLEEHDRRVEATTKIQKRWRVWHEQCRLHGRPLQALRRDTRRLTYELRIAYDSLNIMNSEGGKLPRNWSPDDIEAKYRLLQMAEAIMMKLLTKQQRLQEGVSEVVALREMHAELRQLITSIGISVEEYQKQLSRSRRNTHHCSNSNPGSPQRQSMSGAQDQQRNGLCRSKSRFADTADGDAADDQLESNQGPLVLDGLTPKEKASRVAAGMLDYLGPQMQRQDSNAGRESEVGEEAELHACSVQAEADQLLRDLVLNKAHDHMKLLDAVSSSKDTRHLKEQVQIQVDHIKLQQQAGTWTPYKPPPQTAALPTLSPRPPGRPPPASPSRHPSSRGSDDDTQQGHWQGQQPASPPTFPLQLPESRSSMLQRLLAMPPKPAGTSCSEPLFEEQNGTNSNNHNRPMPSYMQPVRAAAEVFRDKKVVDMFKPPPNSATLVPTVYDSTGIEEAKRRNEAQRVTMSGTGSVLTDKLYQPVQRSTITGRTGDLPCDQPAKRVTFSGKYNESPSQLGSHSNRVSSNGAVSNAFSSTGQDRSPNMHLQQQLQGKSGNGQMSNNLTRLGSSNLSGSVTKPAGNTADFSLPKVRGASSAGGAQEDGQTAFGSMIQAMRQSRTSMPGHEMSPCQQRAASMGSLPAI